MTESVDVVICTTGRASLTQAVHAALAQTYRGVRCVVITDGPASLAAHVGDLLPRADIIPCPDTAKGREGDRLKEWWLNSGQAAPWVKFLDDDDWIPPGAIAAMMAVAEPRVALVVHQMVCVASKDGLPYRWRMIPGEWEPNQIGMGSVLIRTDAAHGISFHTEPASDYRWLCKVRERGEAVRVGLPLYWYNGHRLWRRAPSGEWRREEL